MRIVYVITRADAVGGASIHVRDLARAAIQRGHQVIVLLGGQGPVQELLREAGVPFRSLRHLHRAILPWRDIFAYAELKRALREIRPDLVSCHTAKAGWLARAACASLGLPALYTPHGWAIGNRISSVSGHIFAVAERVASRWTAATICVCDYERALALSRKVCPPERLFVVYNGVHDIPASLRANPALEPPRLVTVARFDQPKDYASLFWALATLPTREWSLDIVGDGPQLAMFRGRARELGLSERIRFLGYREDPAPVLAKAQLFVLSSRSEAFPRSILEALRAGLPVVASRVGGVEEAVEHGWNGLLAAMHDTSALSAALAELLGNRNRRERLGAGARQSYERRFRAERMFEETLAIYDTVMSRTCRPAGIR